MKRKVLSIALSLLMVVTMAPAITFAAGTDCVKDGSDSTKTYDSINEAINAGATNIVLNGDITEVLTIANKNITIDLNGHKWESSATSPGETYALTLNGGATVTIKDSGTAGTIIARGVQTQNTGNTLTIKSGKFVADGGSNGARPAGAAIWNREGNTLNIHGGTFETTAVGSASDSYGSGCVNNSGQATITGGTFNSVNKRTYAIISTGNITIDPAAGKSVEVRGAHGGLAIDAGVAVINGGSFSSTDYYGLYVSNDGKGSPETAAVTVNGGSFSGKTYSVWIGSDHNNPVNSSIEIKGGNFTKPLNAQGNTREGAIVIYGGSFSEAPDEEYLAEGFELKVDGNGHYSVIIPIKTIATRIEAPKVGEEPSYEVGEIVTDPENAATLSEYWDDSNICWYFWDEDSAEEIKWKSIDFNEDYSFKPGETYCVEVWFDPKEGYGFDENTEGTINGMPHNEDAWGDELYRARHGIVCIAGVWTLEENASGPVDGNDKSDDATKTGDNSALMLWIALIVMAAIAGAVTVSYRRKSVIK